jgi:hypothetical protein
MYLLFKEIYSLLGRILLRKLENWCVGIPYNLNYMLIKYAFAPPSGTR